MRADRVNPTASPKSTGQSPSPMLILSTRGFGQFRDSLSIGEVLRGHVLEVLDEQTSIVRFRGFNLITQSESPLQKGAQVHAEVTGLGEQVTMRMLEPGGLFDHAATLMERLGIPVTRGNLSIIALMVRAGVPLTPENIEQVFNALRALGPGTQIAELVVLSRALDVPTSVSTLDTLRFLSEPQIPVGTRLGELAAQLQELLPRIGPEEAPTLRALGTVVGELPLRPEAGSVASQLHEYLRTLGLQYEAALLRGESATNAFKGLLIGARTELLMWIALAGGRGESTALLEAARGNIESLLRSLDAAQLLARIPSLNLPHLYLQIPYWVPAIPNPLTLEVRGRKEDPTGELDPDNIEIEFSVKTHRWGTLHLRFLIREGRIRGSVEAETPEARQFLQTRVQGLIDRLERIGYSVAQISCLVARVLDSGPEPVLMPIHFGEFTFNIEV